MDSMAQLEVWWFGPLDGNKEIDILSQSLFNDQTHQGPSSSAEYGAGMVIS